MNNNLNKDQKIWGSISKRYDFLNHLLSFGLDGYWRKSAVKMADPSGAEILLDMCCGTGDFAFSFAKHCPGLGSITGCDYSDQMIDLARIKESRFVKHRQDSNTSIQWLLKDCSATGFENGSFDIVSCSFGVRNMADLDSGLSEIYRLIRHGGRTCILEFSLPKIPLLLWIYLLHLRYLIPFTGGVLSQKYEAYKYLARSIEQWNKEVDLTAELLKTGFKDVKSKRLTFGITTVYLAYKQ